MQKVCSKLIKMIALSVCASALLTGGSGIEFPEIPLPVNTTEVSVSHYSDPELDFDIRPVEVKHIGNHIYYPEGSFFLEKEEYPGQNEAIRKLLEYKDKEQKIDIYVFEQICNGNSEGVTRIQLFARAYLNGVVMEDWPFRADSADDHKYFTKMFGQALGFPGKNQVILPHNMIPKVEELASKNRSLMLMDKGNLIYGTYLLKMTGGTDHYYYEFTLNHYSYVKMDARTGAVIEYRFSNGVSNGGVSPD